MNKKYWSLLLVMIWLMPVVLMPFSTAMAAEFPTTVIPPANDSPRPAAPSNLTATVQSSTSVLLTWNDNSKNEVEFYLERQESGSGEWITFFIPANSVTYLDTRFVKPNTTYLYRICAAGGVYTSDYSNTCTVQTPPESAASSKPVAPSNLTATAQSENSVLLAWDDNSNDEAEFYLERQEVGTNEWITFFIPANSTTYLDTKYLKANTSYSYRISAAGEVYASDYSNTCTVKTLTEGENTQPPGFSGTEIMFYIGSTTYSVNGQNKTLDAVPVIQDGKVLLPVRYIIEPLGGTATWDDGEQMAVINCNGHVINMWFGQANIIVDGLEKSMDVPPTMINGRTMVQVGFVSECLGCTADWTGSLKRVTIKYASPEI